MTLNSLKLQGGIALAWLSLSLSGDNDASTSNHVSYVW